MLLEIGGGGRWQGAIAAQGSVLTRLCYLRDTQRKRAGSHCFNIEGFLHPHIEGFFGVQETLCQRWRQWLGLRSPFDSVTKAISSLKHTMENMENVFAENSSWSQDQTKLNVNIHTLHNVKNNKMNTRFAMFRRVEGGPTRNSRRRRPGRRQVTGKVSVLKQDIAVYHCTQGEWLWIKHRQIPHRHNHVIHLIILDAFGALTLTLTG